VQARLTDDEGGPEWSLRVYEFCVASDDVHKSLSSTLSPICESSSRISRGVYSELLVRIRYGATGRAQAIQELVGTGIIAPFVSARRPCRRANSRLVKLSPCIQYGRLRCHLGRGDAQHARNSRSLCVIVTRLASGRHRLGYRPTLIAR